MLNPLRSSRAYRAKWGLRNGSGVWRQLRSHHRAPRGSVFPVDPPGFHRVFLRAGTSDFATFLQIFVDEELNFPVRSPKFIVDAGANIGLASVYMAARYPDALVAALEVDQANFDMLVRNTSSLSNVRPLRLGLWSGNTPLRIVNPEAEPWAYCVADAEPGDPRAIPATDVPGLLRRFGQRRVDLLKMDIEGAELHVLRSAGSWIDRVDVLAVELHDRLVPGCGKALADVIPADYTISQRGEYTVCRCPVHHAASAAIS